MAGIHRKGEACSVLLLAWPVPADVAKLLVLQRLTGVLSGLEHPRSDASFRA